MTTLRWQEVRRAALADVLPEALVIVPVGATEQHGPHLPTGTDCFAVSAVVDAALDAASDRAARTLVRTPTVPFGASDHHFPFGATLSLTVETTTAVLADLARSIAVAGGRRVLLVNGHGGNRGPCHSAALAASTRYGMQAAYVDYWTLLPAEAQIPGHAGVFETSLLRHLRAELVAEPPDRAEQPAVPVDVHAEESWRRLDGYSDTPARASADAGAAWFAACRDALADYVVRLTQDLH